MTTRQHRKDVDFCTACPKLCRHACPVGNAECRETVSPWGKMTMLGMVGSGLMAADADNCSLFYKCLGCLLCRTYCEHGIEVPESLIEGRALAYEKGVSPPDVAFLASRFMTTGGPARERLNGRLREKLGPGYFEPGANAVVFAGCVHTKSNPGIAGKLLEAAGKLGADYLGVWDGSPYCCGLPLKSAGLKERFLEHASRVASQLSRYRLVVTPCPGCAHTLRAVYHELGVGITAKVMHAAEFLLPLASKAGIAARPGGTLAYHDPCYLGRYLGVYDAPRKLLEMCGMKVAEFQWRGEGAYCCGGGGNLPLTNRETARKVAAARLWQASVLGADGIATACPSCERMLGGGAADGVDGMDVVDIVDVLHDVLFKS
jgi:Fe-S oxidoreductase